MNCPYDDATCGEPLDCLDCTFDWLVTQGNYKDAADTFNRWGKYFVKQRSLDDPELWHGTAPISKSSKPSGLPPTEKQLAYIESLAKRAGIPVPAVDTLNEAKAKIEELLASNPVESGPSDKQINYLRSLAYERLGPQSEDWVQAKIKEGRKAVSAAISDLVGKRG